MAPAHAAAGGEASAEKGSVFGQYLAGRYARSVGDITSASTYYERVLQEDPDNSDILTRAFLLMLADGRFQSATTLAHKIDKINRSSSLASQVIAVEHIAKPLRDGVSMGSVLGGSAGFLTGFANGFYGRFRNKGGKKG